MNSRDNSENYICRTVTELPAYMQVKIRVPEDIEITAGEIFVADTLDTNLGYGNWDVYVPDTIENANDIPVIVLNNSFETLEDGRRPAGNPDYTQYIYKENEVITTIKLLPEIKLELSPDNFSNFEEFESKLAEGEENIIGTYIYPDLGTNDLQWTDSINNITTKSYLYIEALKWFRLGGLFGGDFAQTLVVRVKENVSTSSEVTDITAINADITPDLRVGEDNVATGATIITMTAEGGTPPITFAFKEDSSLGADNASFVIEDNIIKVGSAALTEAKTYKVYVEASDTEGKTYDEGFDIPVSEAYPNITAVTITPTEGLTAPVSANTVVATLSATGGTAPYTYTLVDEALDNNEFQISGNEVTNIAEIDLASNKHIQVLATDSVGKTLEETGEIVVS